MTLDPSTNTTLENLASEILTHDSFVICGHVNPDGDCLGSMLCLSRALEACGKRVQCVLATADPVELGLRFLPGFSQLMGAQEYWDACQDSSQDFPQGSSQDSSLPEAFISVDVPNTERMGAAAQFHDACAVRFVIDHHPSVVQIGDYRYIDPDSPSASMLVWDLVKALGVKPDAAMADCAYTALMTDTGRFQYQNATAAAFAYAAQMAAVGARPDVCAQEVYQSRSMPSLQLEGVMIDRIHYSPSRQWAYSYVTAEEFRRFGAVKADAEPLIDTLRSLVAVRVVCVLRDQEGVVRGSLGVKDDTLDVSVLARKIGGGGHRAAAGFTFKGSMEQCLEVIAGYLDDLVEGRIS